MGAEADKHGLTTREHDAVAPKSEGAVVERAGEPPVVARLVVEIRSDGTRTIARGALEDREHGQSVMIEADGASPLELAIALAKSVFQLPAFAKTAARALLPGGKKQDKER